MSKQAKESQGYTNSGPVCGNCKHYQSQMVVPTWRRSMNDQAREMGMPEPFGSPGYATEEKAKRCSLGRFAVKKMAWCKEWKSA